VAHAEQLRACGGCVAGAARLLSCPADWCLPFAHKQQRAGCDWRGARRRLRGARVHHAVRRARCVRGARAALVGTARRARALALAHALTLFPPRCAHARCCAAALPRRRRERGAGAESRGRQRGCAAPRSGAQRARTRGATGAGADAPSCAPRPPTERNAGFVPGGVSKFTFRLDASLGELRSVRVRLRPGEGHDNAGWFLQEARLHSLTLLDPAKALA
jgi:hypothetical protein